MNAIQQLPVIGKFRGVRGEKGVFFNSISITFIFYYPYYAVYYYHFQKSAEKFKNTHFLPLNALKCTKSRIDKPFFRGRI